MTNLKEIERVAMEYDNDVELVSKELKLFLYILHRHIFLSMQLA